MRILHLVATPFFSGPAEVIVQLALRQRARGHEVFVACDRKRTTTTAEELLVPRLAAHGLLAELGLELSVKSGPLAALRDVRRLREAPVDVLHSHFSHDHVLAWAARGRRRVVRSIHAPRSLTRWTPPAAGWTVPYADLRSRAPRGAPVEVLPALVDDAFRPPEDRAALRTALGLGSGPLVGMVSTFQPSRRHDVGVRAFAALRQRVGDARLVLVGDGAEEERVRGLVSELGLGESVVFAGYAQGPEFVRWLAALDEVWILGLGNDFGARAAAQARACGVRVVAVDEGAAAEYADAVVVPESAAVAAAALAPSRRARPLPSADEVAGRILALYEQAGRAP